MGKLAKKSSSTASAHGAASSSVHTILKARTIRKSQSSRAGLILPVARFLNKLKAIPQAPGRVSKTAGVYVTAVLEYLIAEIVELSGNACRDNQKSRISPRHLMLAVNNDEELNKLLKQVVIPGAGVLPKLYPFMLDDPLKPATVPKVGPKSAKPTRAVRPKSAPIADFAPLKSGLVKNLSGSKKSKNVTVLSERTLPSGQKLTVVQASITDIAVDGIVHPTNNAFYLGGQVGGAISTVGGQKVRNLVQELHRSHGNLAVCGAAISDAGDMLCKHIIHVYSPHWDTNEQIERIDDLTRCVKNIFTIAETSKLKSIALPSISSGGNGFPKQVAAQTILRAINSYFKSATTTTSNLEQVYFVLYDAESVAIYTSELGKLEI